MSQFPAPGKDPFGGQDPFGQQSTYQSPYQAPQGGPEYGYQASRGPPISPLALTSGIAGLGSILISWLVCCCWVFVPIVFLAGLAAVITGHIALVQFKQYPGRESGREWALIGLICGYVTLALIAILVILTIIAFFVPAVMQGLMPRNGNAPFQFPPIEMPNDPAN